MNSLFIVAPIVCGGFVFGPCFVMQYLVFFLVLQSSLVRKRAAVALPKLCSCCYVAVKVLCLFLMVPWFGL